jgi:hypothetical protein
MDELDRIARTRTRAHAKLRALDSKVYEAFLRVEEAAFSDGALPKKRMREVLEAVEVAIEMGGGPATVSARFALDVMERVFPDDAR